MTSGTKKLIAGKVIPGAFYTLLVVFLALYLRSIDYSEFQNLHVVWKYLIIASVLGLFTRFFQVFIWFVILNSLGADNLRNNTRQLIYVYAKSWLGRYIPGSATWILGKIYFASKHGVSKNKLAVSSLLEGGLQVTVVMAVALLMLVFDQRLDVIDVRFKILMVAIVACCLVAIMPFVFNRVVATIYKILKKKSLHLEHYATRQTIVRGASLYTVGAFLSGISLFFIAKAIYPQLGYSDIWFVMGVGNLAAAVSMLAVFAPSGLGVREGIQLTLLSLIMPTELALLVTITTRLWGVAMDLVFFLVSRLIQSPREDATV